jgi:hypothetical protein
MVRFRVVRVVRVWATRDYRATGVAMLAGGVKEIKKRLPKQPFFIDASRDQ